MSCSGGSGRRPHNDSSFDDSDPQVDTIKITKTVSAIEAGHRRQAADSNKKQLGGAPGMRINKRISQKLSAIAARAKEQSPRHRRDSREASPTGGPRHRRGSQEAGPAAANNRLRGQAAQDGLAGKTGSRRSSAGEKGSHRSSRLAPGGSTDGVGGHGHHHHHHHHHGHKHHHHHHRQSHAAGDSLDPLDNGDGGCVDGLLHQEALLLEQIEFWKARAAKEAELRHACQSELEAHQKHMTEEQDRLREEADVCQAALDAEHRAQASMEEQMLTWQTEQKDADHISKLMAAELRIAKKKVQDVRVKIKSKYRKTMGGGLEYRQGELKFLTEAEADPFREKIAIELQTHLQELPIREVRPCILQIIKTESSEKEVRFSKLDFGSLVKAQSVAREWRRKSCPVSVLTYRSESSGYLERESLAGSVDSAAIVEDADSGGSPSEPARDEPSDSKDRNQLVVEDSHRTHGSLFEPAKKNDGGSDAGSPRASSPRSPKKTSKDPTSPSSSVDVDRAYGDSMKRLASVGIHM